jgi:hypothetical protein
MWKVKRKFGKAGLIKDKDKDFVDARKYCLKTVKVGRRV